GLLQEVLGHAGAGQVVQQSVQLLLGRRDELLRGRTVALRGAKGAPRDFVIGGAISRRPLHGAVSLLADGCGTVWSARLNVRILGHPGSNECDGPVKSNPVPARTPVSGNYSSPPDDIRSMDCAT